MRCCCITTVLLLIFSFVPGQLQSTVLGIQVVSDPDTFSYHVTTEKKNGTIIFQGGDIAFYVA